MIDLRDIEIGCIVAGPVRPPSYVPAMSGMVVDAGITEGGDEYAVVLDERLGSHIVTSRGRNAKHCHSVPTANLRRMFAKDIETVDPVGRNGSGIATLMRYATAALAEIAGGIGLHHSVPLTDGQRALLDAAYLCFNEAKAIVVELSEARELARGGRR